MTYWQFQAQIKLSEDAEMDLINRLIAAGLGDLPRSCVSEEQFERAMRLSPEQIEAGQRAAWKHPPGYDRQRIRTRKVRQYRPPPERIEVFPSRSFAAAGRSHWAILRAE